MLRDRFAYTPAVGDYYTMKYRIVERLGARCIVEIGVRAGYSAFAFLAATGLRDAAPPVYIGFDSGQVGAAYLRHAASMLQRIPGAPAARVELVTLDTQQVDQLPIGPDVPPIDLLHVDGDHSTKGCSHDIMLGVRAGARSILVDDFDGPPEDNVHYAKVHAAVWEFMVHGEGARGNWLAEYFPTAINGSVLLRRAN